jgi:hypothetical protein
MYQMARKGNKDIGIAQTGRGWNVSTYTVNGNRVNIYQDKDMSTLAEARKEFTRQKRIAGGNEIRVRKPSTRRKSSNSFGFMNVRF